VVEVDACVVDAVVLLVLAFVELDELFVAVVLFVVPPPEPPLPVSSPQAVAMPAVRNERQRIVRIGLMAKLPGWTLAERLRRILHGGSFTSRCVSCDQFPVPADPIGRICGTL
jgi:hypothetical protein